MKANNQAIQSIEGLSIEKIKELGGLRVRNKSERYNSTLSPTYLSSFEELELVHHSEKYHKSDPFELTQDSPYKTVYFEIKNKDLIEEEALAKNKCKDIQYKRNSPKFEEEIPSQGSLNFLYRFLKVSDYKKSIASRINIGTSTEKNIDLIPQHTSVDFLEPKGGFTQINFGPKIKIGI